MDSVPEFDHDKWVLTVSATVRARVWARARARGWSDRERMFALAYTELLSIARNARIGADRKEALRLVEANAAFLSPETHAFLREGLRFAEEATPRPPARPDDEEGR